MDFAVPADHRVTLKECEKRPKYPDLARELKKLWNMKVTIIPIVCVALGTVTKGLVQWLEDLEIRGWVKAIHYWNRPEYWEESWRPEETCWHSNASEKPSANAGVKISHKRTNNNGNKAPLNNDCLKINNQFFNYKSINFFFFFLQKSL